MSFHYETLPVNPETPHTIRYKEERDLTYPTKVNTHKEDKPCSICGAIEETDVCSRTIYSGE